MRVAYVTLVDLTGTSGQNVYSRHVATALGRRPDVDLTLVCPRSADGLPDAVAAAVADTIFLPAKRSRSLRWHLEVQRPLRTALADAHRRGSLDAVVSTLRPSLLVPPLFARRHGVPYRLLVEGALGPEVREIADVPLAGAVTTLVSVLNVRASDRVFAVNEGVAEWVRDLPGTDALVTVLPHGVDVPAGSTTDPLPPSDLPPTEVVVGYVGSFKPYHCLPALVDATARLREDGRDVGLLLVGNGPEFDAVVERASDRGIRDVTATPGFVNPAEIGRYIDAADVCYGVVDPDRVGSPMKVYEYLGRGRPVVATAGPEFAFVDRVGAGAHVDEPSGRAVADALARLFDASPERRAAMGAAGREYVERRGLTWDDAAARILADL